jgi:protein-S-isoprenylcysteine O-methyltransferase Ste14
MSTQKEWQVDIAPIVFFTLVVGVKTYALMEYVQQQDDLWNLIADPQTRAAAGSGLGYYLSREFSYLAYYLTALAFDMLVLYSFLVRHGAQQRPKGFWENIFPLLTVFIPVIGFTLMLMPEVRALLPSYPERFLQALASITPMFPYYINVAAFLIGLSGAAFSIWAIAHLRASFGLRAAVRELVTTGPYRRIRHPLYFGEIIHILGIAILAATPAAIYLFILAVAMQAIRARIEERKFLTTVPDYASFRRNTGFLWPRIFPVNERR